MRGKGDVAGQERTTLDLGEVATLQCGEAVEIAGVFEKVAEFLPACAAAAELHEKWILQRCGRSAPERQPTREARCAAKPRVTAKQLITAETGERSGDATGAGELADVVGVY